MTVAEWLHDYKRRQRFIEWGSYLAQRAECKLAQTAAETQQQPLMLPSRCIMRLFPSSRSGYKADARKKSYEKEPPWSNTKRHPLSSSHQKKIINHPGKQRPIFLSQREILQSQAEMYGALKCEVGAGDDCVGLFFICNERSISSSSRNVLEEVPSS